MSELINARHGQKNFRWQLLTTASALALLATICAAGDAQAEDSDSGHPTIWIELGGQAQRVDSSEDPFSAPFLSPLPKVFGAAEPFENQRPARYSYGTEGKVSFQPDGLDWKFSAAFLYGRSNRNKHSHHETSHPTTTAIFHIGTITNTGAGIQIPANIADVSTNSSETHAIADFQAGKDVGLGMFSSHGKSTVALGVRFAQFTSGASANIDGQPSVHLQTNLKYPALRTHDGLLAHAKRSFSGVGPSISWDASVYPIGVSDGSGMTLDWGLNASVLFGRQNANVHHETTKLIYKTVFFATTKAKYHQTHSHNTADSVRRRSLIVPNLGGFAGLSFHLPNGKVSLGYRADFFFGAMDGGIDVRKTENRGFYGPFATVSMGIGG